MSNAAVVAYTKNLQLGDLCHRQGTRPKRAVRAAISDVLHRRKCYQAYINGDDTVVLATRLEIDRLKRLGALAGLECSVGKSYWSRDWFVFNSEFYGVVGRRSVEDQFVPHPPRHYEKPLCGHFDPQLLRLWNQWTESEDPSVELFDRLAVLNFGAAFRVSGRGMTQYAKDMDGARTIADDELTRLASNTHYVCSRAPASHRETMLSLMLTHNDKLLKRVPASVSWWLPADLGGLGMYCHDPSRLLNKARVYGALRRLHDDEPFPHLATVNSNMSLPIPKDVTTLEFFSDGGGEEDELDDCEVNRFKCFLRNPGQSLDGPRARVCDAFRRWSRAASFDVRAGTRIARNKEIEPRFFRILFNRSRRVFTYEYTSSLIPTLSISGPEDLLLHMGVSSIGREADSSFDDITCDTFPTTQMAAAITSKTIVETSGLPVTGAEKRTSPAADVCVDTMPHDDCGLWSAGYEQSSWYSTGLTQERVTPASSSESQA
jgi:hypothetical protein